MEIEWDRIEASATLLKSELERALINVVSVHGKDAVAMVTFDAKDNRVFIESGTELLHDYPKDCTLEDCHRCKSGMSDVSTRYKLEPQGECKLSEGNNRQVSMPCNQVILFLERVVKGSLVEVHAEIDVAKEKGAAFGVVCKNGTIWIQELGEDFPILEISNCIPICH